MTMQTLLALHHSAPLAVRLLLDLPVEKPHRLILLDKLSKGSISQYRGFQEWVITAHPETWAEWKRKALPLREAFLREIDRQRGGAA